MKIYKSEVDKNLSGNILVLHNSYNCYDFFIKKSRGIDKTLSFFSNGNIIYDTYDISDFRSDSKVKICIKK